MRLEPRSETDVGVYQVPEGGAILVRLVDWRGDGALTVDVRTFGDSDDGRRFGKGVCLRPRGWEELLPLLRAAVADGPPWLGEERFAEAVVGEAKKNGLEVVKLSWVRGSKDDPPLLDLRVFAVKIVGPPVATAKGLRLPAEVWSGLVPVIEEALAKLAAPPDAAPALAG